MSTVITIRALFSFASGVCRPPRTPQSNVLHQYE